MTAFYLDCDTGVDDAFALAVLAAVDLAGIGTVSGNTSAGQAARNTLDLLALAGQDKIPVAVGAHHPLAGDFGGGASRVHGGNGIGGVTLPTAPRTPLDTTAAELLVKLSKEHELRIVATGPLTNLALALRLDPALPDRIQDVTVMGGAVRVPGNITPHAEANIANDPEAAAAVLAAGWDVTLVPLDVTLQHRFDEHDRAALARRGTPLTSALAEMISGYFDYYETVFGVRASPLHDPLAACVAVGEVRVGEAPRLGLRVALDGEERGRLIEDPAVEARTRVVLTLAEPGAPVIRRLILGG